MEQTEIRKVRASIHQQCGNRVKIQQDLGRNKVDNQEGVIQQAYPSVFTVLIDDEFEQNPPQLLSFTYTDVITKDIRMQLCYYHELKMLHLCYNDHEFKYLHLHKVTPS